MGYSSEDKEGTGREAAGEGRQLGVNDSLLIDSSVEKADKGQSTRTTALSRLCSEKKRLDMYRTALGHRP